MLSRVADTIYWLGRYMERTSGMLQAIRTEFLISQDCGGEFAWTPLLNIYGELNEEQCKAIEKHSPLALEYMIFSPENGASVYNNVMQSRENARSIQDHITKEVWQCLNDYYHFIRNDHLRQQVLFGDPVSAIDMLIRNGLLFTGTVDNTMTRGEGLTYLNIGKYLERAIHSADATRIKMQGMGKNDNPATETADIRCLLYTLFGFEVFIKTYKGNFTRENMLELILYHNNFPHSIIYSLERLQEYFERLRTESISSSFEELSFLIGKTLSKMKYSSMHEGDILTVNAFLFETRMELFEIASALSKNYFGNT